MPAELRKDFATVMRGLYAAFIESDADLAEINPLVITEDGKLLALDAKIVLDDSALFRHPDLEAMRDLNEEEPSEIAAREAGINFIKLDGSIGCMVNGAGLAMTTMDLVKLAGGEPANFLDIGGGAKADKVAAAFRIILDDPNVKAILINIFGGITRGDEVARGIVEARAELDAQVPMVVRIVGTNAAEAAEILRAGQPDHRRQPGRRRRQGGRGRGRAGMSILVGRADAAAGAGHHRPRRRVPLPGDARLRDTIVAGVTPGKGGQSALDGRVPVFDTVADAVRETGANAACIFVPAPFAPDAMLEAADAGMPLVICITEGDPGARHAARVPRAQARGVRLIGPNCPGATTPGEAKVGIIPGDIHRPGPVGLVSRSGTLTYEVVQAMTDAGMGQSTCVGIGGDPIVGTTFIDVLDMFNADPATEAIVMIGEIGGDEEERAADFCAREVRKPMAAFIAGRTAPPGRRMGHAGAIISGGAGTAESKRQALEAAGIRVADSPSQIPRAAARGRGRRASPPAVARGAPRAPRSGCAGE